MDKERPNTIPSADPSTRPATSKQMRRIIHQETNRPTNKSSSSKKCCHETSSLSISPLRSFFFPFSPCLSSSFSPFFLYSPQHQTIGNSFAFFSIVDLLSDFEPTPNDSTLQSLRIMTADDAMLFFVVSIVLKFYHTLGYFFRYSQKGFFYPSLSVFPLSNLFSQHFRLATNYAQIISVRRSDCFRRAIFLLSTTQSAPFTFHDISARFSHLL